MAILYPVAANHPSLSGKWPTDADKQEEQNALAEQLLDLRGPAYTDANAVEELTRAVVLQINFQLQHGIEPHVIRTANQSNPGVSTTYRDRYVNPEAMALVCRVTGRRYVGFTVPGAGV
jgi:hypothetical protein